MYLFCLIANGTDKLNFLKRLLAIPEIPTWLCCFLPGSTHSLHVSHKFYTIPVIVFLVFKPSLYRLNWIRWRLRNNRLLSNAYWNLLKHILSKHNHHQYKIMIHRWLCLILCQRKFIFQNNWKIINTNSMSTNSFRPFFGYFWQVFIGAYWYKHIILC